MFFLVHSSNKTGSVFSLRRRKRGVLGCRKWVLDWTLAAQHKEAHITKDLHICEQFETGGRKQRHFITFLKFKTPSKSGAFGIVCHPRLNPPFHQFWQISIPRPATRISPVTARERKESSSRDQSLEAWMKSSACDSRPVRFPSRILRNAASRSQRRHGFDESHDYRESANGLEFV